MLRKGRKDVGWGSGGAERPGVGGRAGEPEERAWGPSVNWGARWGAVCRRLHGRCGWC